MDIKNLIPEVPESSPSKALVGESALDLLKRRAMERGISLTPTNISEVNNQLQNPIDTSFLPAERSTHEGVVVKSSVPDDDEVVQTGPNEWTRVKNLN